MLQLVLNLTTDVEIFAHYLNSSGKCLICVLYNAVCREHLPLNEGAEIAETGIWRCTSSTFTLSICIIVYLNYCTDFDNKAVILHELLASLFLDLSELNMETTSTLSLSREIHKEDSMDFTQKSGMRSVWIKVWWFEREIH